MSFSLEDITGPAPTAQPPPAQPQFQPHPASAAAPPLPAAGSADPPASDAAVELLLPHSNGAPAPGDGGPPRELPPPRLAPLPKPPPTAEERREAFFELLRHEGVRAPVGPACLAGEICPIRDRSLPGRSLSCHGQMQEGMCKCDRAQKTSMSL